MGDLDPPLSVLHTEQLLRLVIYIMWVMEKSVEPKAPPSKLKKAKRHLVEHIFFEKNIMCYKKLANDIVESNF